MTDLQNSESDDGPIAAAIPTEGAVARATAVEVSEGDIANGPQEGRESPQTLAASSAAGSGNAGCCVEQSWAVVTGQGALVRGRNVWRVQRLAAGIYEVVFNRDVSDGVYTATIGRPEYGVEPAGMIGVALRWGLPGPEGRKGVWVDTHDPNGRRADRGFHLVVQTEH